MGRACSGKRIHPILCEFSSIHFGVNATQFPPLRTSHRITGLVAAPFTPLSDDCELALARIPVYAASLVRDGVAGAFICGTTGEGASLTTAERMTVASAWCSIPRLPIRIIVHVGHNSGADSRNLARHAQKVGADAIATLAPSVFRPTDIAGLVDWCALIAAAAPRLSFYYYHMPSMAGADFGMAEFLRAASRRIPTFAGIKFTHDNLMDFGDTLRAAGTQHSVLAGRDEILISYLVLGATGAVGSTYNYAAPIYHQLIAAHAAGDLKTARKWQDLVRAFIGVMARSGGMSANKAIMGMVTGIECGPVRLPLRSLGKAHKARLRADLTKIGFFAGLAAARRAAVK